MWHEGAVNSCPKSAPTLPSPCADVRSQRQRLGIAVQTNSLPSGMFQLLTQRHSSHTRLPVQGITGTPSGDTFTVPVPQHPALPGSKEGAGHEAAAQQNFGAAEITQRQSLKIDPPWFCVFNPILRHRTCSLRLSQGVPELPASRDKRSRMTLSRRPSTALETVCSSCSTAERACHTILLNSR